jgi:hypothetical protein
LRQARADLAGKTIVCWLLYMPKPYQLDELDARIAVGAKR